MKQSYSDKAIKLAIKHGYTGGWHQPNKDVFDDENFWRSAGRAFGYNEWRNLYERYLDRMRYGESDNEFWRMIFGERNCPAGCGLKFHEGITCETAKRNVNVGKSKCCNAEVEWNDGGYDGESIVSVSSRCKKCGKFEPKVIKKIGRPIKLPF